MAGDPASAYESLARYPLLDALLGRRSRRFGRGMRLDGGPLAFGSALDPQPLTLAEEAAMDFAANGVTGPTLAELPFAPSAAGSGWRVPAATAGKALFGALELLALARYARTIDWSGGGGWIYPLWLLNMLTLGLYGLLALARATRGRLPEPVAPRPLAGD